MRREAEAFAAALQKIVGDHAIFNRVKILEVAQNNGKQIASLIEAAAHSDHDFLQTDHLREQLAELFEGRTGARYSAPRLNEIYKEGANRFSRRIPPGYKDGDKGEPERYGDLVIWFEVMDQAKSSGKPLILVTADAKEDWWAEHKGNTVGPRPELGQEILAYAGVRFYMYTPPQFLKFAQKFLKLNAEAARKAVSEFERIEKQDRHAAESHDSMVAAKATAEAADASNVSRMLSEIAKANAEAVDLYKASPLVNMAKVSAQAAEAFRQTMSEIAKANAHTFELWRSARLFEVAKLPFDVPPHPAAQGVQPEQPHIEAKSADTEKESEKHK